MTYCKYCDEPLKFHEHHISDSGKKIPLDRDTGEPHNCPERPSSNYTIECKYCDEEIYFDEGVCKQE
ncbi:MAG: hypothetical protein WCF23_16540 [Candidatus Nitrosopolaris sp.]